MLKNYLKIALRNLLRDKTISIINVAGLALGLATCLMILLFIRYEWSFDRFHAKADRIVRVVFRGDIQGEKINEPMVMPPVAATLVDEFPEVEEATRLRRVGRPGIAYDGNVDYADEVAFVDANFFSVFTLPLTRGDAATALVEPGNVVISETVASKLFGADDPLGKPLRFADWNATYTVTGVMRDIPENSHFNFDVLPAMAGWDEARSPSWMTSEFYTYLVLPPAYDPAELEAKLPAIIDKYVGPQIQAAMGITMDAFQESGNRIALQLQPLTDIHLHSDFAFDLSTHGDIRYLYLFGAIAVFMLLIACINFMNISTAGASRRAREVGIRKVLGSRKGDLVKQFLLESFVLTTISLALALVIVQLTLPLFNQLAERPLRLDTLPVPWLVGGLLAVGLLTGLLSGSYPAFFLANFRTTAILKGDTAAGKSRISLRSGLVVFQFFLTITLIFSTVVVFRQLQYIQDAKLGYDTDSVLIVQDVDALGPKAAAFRQTIERDPRIARVGYSGYLPAGETYNNNYFLTTGDDYAVMTKTLRYDVDENYLPTLNMQLVTGRNFSPDRGTDSSAIILNETALAAFGWSPNEALDQILTNVNNEGRVTHHHVIGVVEDFHFKSLHERISPLVMVLRPGGGSAILKVKTTDTPALLADLRDAWNALNRDHPFTASFLDERVEATYRAERRIGILLAVFAGLTVFVACLGLLGLTIYATARRTREIGIRKVLGASVKSLVGLLTRDFIRLVAIAFVPAFPLAWWVMQRWLRDFAYRVELSWWMFALAGGLAVAVAFVTVAYQSVRAALTNPVEVLRRP